MLTRQRLANPLGVRQAPDNKAIQHSTQLVIGTKQLETPPMAQEYFEPGINTKLTRRSKPKTNYTLPSDMPTYPLGFVPVNQTPGALGEEPPIIKVKEAVPGDLLTMFATISAQQAAESRAVEEAKVSGAMDIGSLVSREYQAVLTEAQTEARAEKLAKEGFTQTEVEDALGAARMERAIQLAKTPIPSAVVSVETALAEKFPKQGEPEKPKLTHEDIAQFKARATRETKMEREVARFREQERKEDEKEEGSRLVKGGTKQEKEFRIMVERLRQEKLAGEKPLF